MTFQEFVEQLEARAKNVAFPPLLPQRVADAEFSRALTQTPDEVLFPEVRNPMMAQLCRAGLLLMNDDLDGSHAIAQRYEGDQTADCWHAIMHRREGDLSNARYWWHRVGVHPAFDPLPANMLTMLDNMRELRADASPGAQAFVEKLQREKLWLPAEFSDVCINAGDPWLVYVQWAEFVILLSWCQARVSRPR